MRKKITNTIRNLIQNGRTTIYFKIKINNNKKVKATTEIHPFLNIQYKKQLCESVFLSQGPFYISLSTQTIQLSSACLKAGKLGQKIQSAWSGPLRSMAPGFWQGENAFVKKANALLRDQDSWHVGSACTKRTLASAPEDFTLIGRHQLLWLLINYTNI